MTKHFQLLLKCEPFLSGKSKYENGLCNSAQILHPICKYTALIKIKVIPGFFFSLQIINVFDKSTYSQVRYFVW